MNIIRAVLFTSLTLLTSSLFAEKIKVADVFSDHMVLQRGKIIPIWGTAPAGESITVEFKGQKLTTTTDKTGQWNTKLQTLKADDKPAVMIISGATETLKLQDILVGEVWLCSGQSNMVWMVSWSAEGKDMLPQAARNDIRLLKVPRRPGGFPYKQLDARWQKCTLQTVKTFSSVGYYFGLELNKKLKVPIGLIQSAWGGTKIEPWTPSTGFRSVKETNYYLSKISKANVQYQKKLKKCLPYMQNWLKKALLNNKQGKPIPPLEPEYPSHPLNSYQAPTGLFNAMISPLIPYAIRGVIWYQGEANCEDGTIYFYKMKALIEGWRKLWGQGDFPFYFVQLAPFAYPPKRVLPLLWAAQYRAAREINNCGLVFPGRVDNLNDIHPKHKLPVAQRLATLALSKTYGQKLTDIQSPVFKNMKLDGHKAVICFDLLDNCNLKTDDGEAPREFMIAGKDKKFFPANAKIKGKTVILCSDKVSTPYAVKYAWHNKPSPNLITGKGFPVHPFQSLPIPNNVAYGKKYVSSHKNPWGWEPGLTDGSSYLSKDTCYATDTTNQFPKNVTIDLEKNYQIDTVTLAVPRQGSTRTVTVELSIDGKSFSKVGSVTFIQNKAEKKEVHFPAADARYIRMFFVNNYPKTVVLNSCLMLLTEVEAFEATKKSSKSKK